MATTAETARERRAANRQAGLCACGRDPRPGKKTCQICGVAAPAKRKKPTEREQRAKLAARAQRTAWRREWKAIIASGAATCRAGCGVTDSVEATYAPHLCARCKSATTPG